MSLIVNTVGGFPAKYAGTCGGCGAGFKPGEVVKYTDDDVLVALACCGSLLADRGTLDDPGSVMAEDELTATAKQQQDLIALTMPRGARRTAQGRLVRCERCFQVPASNGSCSC